jgi:hypothetical protein
MVKRKKEKITNNDLQNTTQTTNYRASLDLQLPVQSVHIASKVVSSNPAHGEVYSIEHYVIKFVSDLRSDTPTCPPEG